MGSCGHCCMPRFGRVVEAKSNRGRGTADPATICSAPTFTTRTALPLASGILLGSHFKTGRGCPCLAKPLLTPLHQCEPTKVPKAGMSGLEGLYTTSSPTHCTRRSWWAHASGAPQRGTMDTHRAILPCHMCPLEGCSRRGYSSGRESTPPKSKAKPGSNPESQPMKPLLRWGISHTDQMHAPRSRQVECLCQNATANQSHQRLGLCSRP